jgi:hypothetical protein
VDVHAGVMGSGEEAVEEEGGMGTDELVVRRRGGGGGAGMGWGRGWTLIFLVRDDICRIAIREGWMAQN